MLFLGLGQFPSLTDIAAKGEELVIRGLTDVAKKDATSWGFLGVAVGTLFVTGLTWAAFRASGARRNWAPALIMGVGSAGLGTFFVLRTRKAIEEYPESLKLPPAERIAQLKPLWFAVGVQGAR